MYGATALYADAIVLPTATISAGNAAVTAAVIPPAVAAAPDAVNAACAAAPSTPATAAAPLAAPAVPNACITIGPRKYAPAIIAAA